MSDHALFCGGGGGGGGGGSGVTNALALRPTNQPAAAAAHAGRERLIEELLRNGMFLRTEIAQIQALADEEGDSCSLEMDPDAAAACETLALFVPNVAEATARWSEDHPEQSITTEGMKVRLEVLGFRRVLHKRTTHDSGTAASGAKAAGAVAGDKRCNSTLKGLSVNKHMSRFWWRDGFSLCQLGTLREADLKLTAKRRRDKEPPAKASAALVKGTAASCLSSSKLLSTRKDRMDVGGMPPTNPYLSGDTGACDSLTPLPGVWWDPLPHGGGGGGSGPRTRLSLGTSATGMLTAPPLRPSNSAVLGLSGPFAELDLPPLSIGDLSAGTSGNAMWWQRW